MDPAARRQVLGQVVKRLKFPQLFALTATLFVLDLLIPDLIPFADEILLGLATALFALWREDAPAPVPEPPRPRTEKNVTPPEERR